MKMSFKRWFWKELEKYVLNLSLTTKILFIIISSLIIFFIQVQIFLCIPVHHKPKTDKTIYAAISDR
jgi:hypothetical protein